MLLKCRWKKLYYIIMELGRSIILWTSVVLTTTVRRGSTTAIPPKHTGMEGRNARACFARARNMYLFVTQTARATLMHVALGIQIKTILYTKLNCVENCQVSDYKLFIELKQWILKILRPFFGRWHIMTVKTSYFISKEWIIVMIMAWAFC